MVTPMRIVPLQLTALLAEHDVGAKSYDEERIITLALAHFGMEFQGDGAPDGGPTRYDHDTRTLATVLVQLANTVQAMRDATQTGQNVPAVTLCEAIEAPYVCDVCDQQACVCWAYDEEKETPVDVHPAYRVQEAAAIQAHRRRELAKAASARALHMAVVT